MNLRHITLHQIRLFHGLGKHLSYTRAAEELHLSQPAMSIQIKRLEESVGLPLVDKMGKRIFLTEAGLELFETAKDILERLDNFNVNMLQLDKRIKGPLKLGAISTAKYFMPQLLGVFLRNYPEVEPNLTITNQATVIQRLEENMDDLVIMGRKPDHLELEAKSFLENPLVVIASTDHPLANEKNISLERIANERFISRELGSGTREALRRLFADNGFEVKPYMELGSAEAVKQAVMVGLGVSVMSLHNLQLELEVGKIAILDIKHFPLERKWYVVHLKGKQLSSVASHFRDFLIEDGEGICSVNISDA